MGRAGAADSFEDLEQSLLSFVNKRLGYDKEKLATTMSPRDVDFIAMRIRDIVRLLKDKKIALISILSGAEKVFDAYKCALETNGVSCECYSITQSKRFIEAEGKKCYKPIEPTQEEKHRLQNLTADLLIVVDDDAHSGYSAVGWMLYLFEFNRPIFTIIDQDWYGLANFCREKNYDEFKGIKYAIENLAPNEFSKLDENKLSLFFDEPIYWERDLKLETILEGVKDSDMLLWVEDQNRIVGNTAHVFFQSLYNINKLHDINKPSSLLSLVHKKKRIIGLKERNYEGKNILVFVDKNKEEIVKGELKRCFKHGLASAHIISVEKGYFNIDQYKP